MRVSYRKLHSDRGFVRYKVLYGLCIFALLNGATSCEDGLDDTEIRKPNGKLAKQEELSAGISTLFNSGPKAYDQAADWVTGEYDTRFNLGDNLYDRSRGTGEGVGNGLGPVYAGLYRRRIRHLRIFIHASIYYP